VLTAGHVSGKPGQKCTLILPDGKELEGKTFGYNRDMDSGMIKITKKGKYPYAKMGDSSKLAVSEWVLAIGHPGGYKSTRSTVVRLGRVNKINKASIAEFGGIYTDCTLVGGDSGGPLFDMQGRVVGIHSQIRARITENVHVPINTYRETYDRLAKGEVWGSPLSGFFFSPTPPANSAYLGVAFDTATTDLRIDEVTEDAPAEKAGLKSGDVILAIDDVKLKIRSELTTFLSKKKPNDEVLLVVRRDGAEMKFKVKLGLRTD
jgi:serine protease Do